MTGGEKRALRAEQVAEILRLYAAGLRYAEIAERLGMCYNTVQKTIWKRTPRKPRYRLGSQYDRDQYTPEQSAFLRGVIALKSQHPHPSWAEVLEMARALGYRRTEEATEEYRHLYEHGACEQHG